MISGAGKGNSEGKEKDVPMDLPRLFRTVERCFEIAKEAFNLEERLSSRQLAMVMGRLQGDALRRAQDALAVLLRTLVGKMLWRLSVHSQDWEDLREEVLWRICTRVSDPSFFLKFLQKGGFHFDGWVAGVCRNVVKEHWRAKRKWWWGEVPEPLDAEEMAAPSVQWGGEQSLWVDRMVTRSVMERLSPEERELIRKDKSDKQLAKELKTSVAAVRAKRYRLWRRLCRDEEGQAGAAGSAA